MKTRKIFAFLLAAVMLLNMACFITSCADPEIDDESGGDIIDEINNQEVDASKAQLYISNFNGGYGDEYLGKAILRFCEMYKDKEFVPGTKGVQCWVEDHKKDGASTAATMKGSRNEVYFLENCNYYDMVSSGHLLDITDIVTEKLTAYGEDQSIEDKMIESYRDYFKTSQDKYYAVPHYIGFYGITYDVDTFNEQQLYLSDEGYFECVSTSENLSNGPDGMPGTYDDGLPATYEEFFELCGEMQKRGVTPIGWSGMYDFYITCFMESLKADFEGSEALLSFTFDGTATKLLDTDASGKVQVDGEGNLKYLPATTITEENGYLMYQSAGAYYAYKFIEALHENNYYFSRSFNGSISHTDIQSLYAQSRFKKQQGMGDNGMAMLVEGEWWVNEAAPTFQSMKTYKNATLEERNLAIMPLPKATAAQVGQKQIVLDNNATLAAISAYVAPEKVELAKTFLQFMETNETLCESFACTHTPRAYYFDYSGIYDSLCTFSRSVLDLCYQNGEILAPRSSSNFYYKNYTSFIPEEAVKTPQHPTPARAINDGVSADTLFAELQAKYGAHTWANMLVK